MSAQVAIFLCCVGVGGLFYLNRDPSTRNSKALWIPITWILLAGSRSVTDWFGLGHPDGLAGTLEGSPVDAAVFAALEAAGIFVLISRKGKAKAYLLLILPLLAYSAYCLISASWSPFPVPAVKRWTKDVGDMAMVLVVLTDPRPVAAIRRVFSTVGFILLPFSIVLIRYTMLGRTWDADGALAIVGVTDNKNALGLIVYLVSLGTVWTVLSLMANKSVRNRNRKLLAQGVLLLCGLMILGTAHCSTAIACFILGGSVLLVTRLRAISHHPLRIHVLALALFACGGATLFGGRDEVASTLGRASTLTGRTDIWHALLPAVSNPIMGVGFDSFWTSPNATLFHQNLNLLHWYHAEYINEAHNGYLEVYLNLGWIGIVLMSTILIGGYLRANKAFRRDPIVGSLFLAFIISGAFYCITEVGFRTLSPMWIFLLLSYVGASGAQAGLFGAETKKSAVIPGARTGLRPSIFDWKPEKQVAKPAETTHAASN
ncbi:O-antigen ligase family protein [Telmatobacter sp. DSM 110680]|uniref:O-antigen ligase family protein n=1 Tax=Telmatobacter sp. DSM 110680 TaxID=3036704 RepID=A0AAU7DE47_9BACT